MDRVCGIAKFQKGNATYPLPIICYFQSVGLSVKKYRHVSEHNHTFYVVAVYPSRPIVWQFDFLPFLHAVVDDLHGLALMDCDELLGIVFWGSQHFRLHLHDNSFYTMRYHIALADGEDQAEQT